MDEVFWPPEPDEPEGITHRHRPAEPAIEIGLSQSEATNGHGRRRRREDRGWLPWRRRRRDEESP